MRVWPRASSRRWRLRDGWKIGAKRPRLPTARMNRWIEQEVRRLPVQYLWVHKRFKTRPEGEAGLY